MLVSFWLFLFIIKLYSGHNIFKYIGNKHGKDIYHIVRSFEMLKRKFKKVTLDIKLVKICKREGLILTFAYLCLLIKQQKPKLKRRISRIVMENEVQTKYREKHNLKKDIKAISYQTQRLLPTLV